MANRFRELSLSNVKYHSGLHQSTKLNEKAVLVQKVLGLQEVQKFSQNRQLDLDGITKNVYAHTPKFTVVIPVEPAEGNGPASSSESLMVFVDPAASTFTVKLLSIAADKLAGTMTFSLANPDGTNAVASTFDQSFREIAKEQSSDIAVQETFSQCLKRLWGNLPWWLQAACAGSCGACFGLNPAACAVCAGCIGGNAIDCI
jgi:hypothetical protein